MLILSGMRSRVPYALQYRLSVLPAVDSRKPHRQLSGFLVDAKSVWLQAEERAVCIAGGILDRSVRAMRVNSPLLPRPHGIRQLAAKRESGDFSAGMALDHVEIFDIC